MTTHTGTSSPCRRVTGHAAGDAVTSAAVVSFYLNSNTLAKASLMGLYKR